MIDVKHIAQLANLSIKEDEIGKYESSLSNILDLISQLKEIDTKTIAETSQVTGLKNIWREDEIDSSRILKHDKSFFSVPKIFE